jgi:DnaJ-class molecular chaperone
MSYYHCPIEPSDWSDGPNDPPECPKCGGYGWVIVKPTIPAYSEHGDLEREQCPRCHGEGYLTGDDHFDDDVI